MASSSCDSRNGSKLIAGRYRLRKKIDYGSLNKICAGECIENGEEVAVKVEVIDARKPSLIPHEYSVYQILQGETGIPRTLWCGASGNQNVLVMELLGPNLEDLFNKCMRQLSLKTVLMLALQMLERIEYMHNMHFIHRDIKPTNFVIGLGKNSKTVYIIDYGLSKRFTDSKTNDHVAFTDERSSLCGTPRFASISTHLGVEQSQRDDLESLGYILIYLLKGTLPWKKTSAKTKKEKIEEICQLKLSTTASALCQGLPSEFKTFLIYARGLDFKETPDYNKLYQLFLELLQAHGYDNDGIFDWMEMDDSDNTNNSNPTSLSIGTPSGDTTPTNESPSPQ